MVGEHSPVQFVCKLWESAVQDSMGGIYLYQCKHSGNNVMDNIAFRITVNSMSTCEGCLIQNSLHPCLELSVNSG